MGAPKQLTPVTYTLYSGNLLGIIPVLKSWTDQLFLQDKFILPKTWGEQNNPKFKVDDHPGCIERNNASLESQHKLPPRHVRVKICQRHQTLTKNNRPEIRDGPPFSEVVVNCCSLPCYLRQRKNHQRLAVGEIGF